MRNGVNVKYIQSKSEKIKEWQKSHWIEGNFYFWH